MFFNRATYLKTAKEFIKRHDYTASTTKLYLTSEVTFAIHPLNFLGENLEKNILLLLSFAFPA